MTDTLEQAEERAAFVALDVVKCVACGKASFVKRGEPFKCVCGATEGKLPLDGCRAA